MSDKHEVSDASWFEKPANVNKLIVGLVVVCVGLVLADFFYVNDHAHFPIEKLFGFQAVFGFVAFVVVVFLGVGLRRIIKRDEGYYDR